MCKLGIETHYFLTKSRGDSQLTRLKLFPKLNYLYCYSRTTYKCFKSVQLIFFTA